MLCQRTGRWRVLSRFIKEEQIDEGVSGKICGMIVINRVANMRVRVVEEQVGLGQVGFAYIRYL